MAKLPAPNSRKPVEPTRRVVNYSPISNAVTNAANAYESGSRNIQVIQRQSADSVRDLASAVVKAEDLTQKRKENVDRIRISSDAYNWANEYVRDYFNKNDMTDSVKVEALNSDLTNGFSQRVSQAAETHRPESVDLLDARLQELLGNLKGNVYAASHEQSNKLITSDFDSRLGALVNAAYKDPVKWANWLELGYGLIGEYRENISTPMEEDFAKRMNAGISGAVIASYVERGAVDEANDMLGSDELKAALDTKVRLQLQRQVTAAIHERDKYGKEISARLAAVKTLFPNSKMSREQQLQYALTGKVTESGAETLYGKSMPGLTYARIVDPNRIAAFREDRMSADQMDQYISDVTAYLTPRTVPDPVTQQPITVTPRLPPHVETMLQNKGYDLGDLSSPRRVPAPGTTPQTPQASPSAQTSERPPIDVGIPGGDTIWKLAGLDLLAGPIAKGAAALHGDPVAGQVIDAPQMRRAQTAVTLMQRDLTRVMQTSPKYAETERRSIEAEVQKTLTGKFWQNKKALLDDIIALDAFLIQRSAVALSASDPTKSTLGAEARRHALQVHYGVEMFRNALGAPVRYKKWSDALAAVGNMKEGEQLVGPDGVLRKKDPDIDYNALIEQFKSMNGAN